MSNEYAIQIGLSPHEHDNPIAPYYWCLLKFNTDWCNECCGWSKKPEQAFEDAHKIYSELTKS
jgi:hypothetical protein